MTIYVHPLISPDKIFRSKEERRLYAKISTDISRAKKIKFIQETKKECYICKHNQNLTFHHLNNKKFNIGSTGSRVSWNKLHNEINKCIVICRECHDKVEKMKR